MLQPRRYTFTGTSLGIEHAYRVLASTTVKFVLDQPSLGAMRSDPEKQAVAIAKKPVASGRAGFGGFTGFGGQLAHGGGDLGGILGGTLGGILLDWVGLLQIVRLYMIELSSSIKTYLSILSDSVG